MIRKKSEAWSVLVFFRFTRSCIGGVRHVVLAMGRFECSLCDLRRNGLYEPFTARDVASRELCDRIHSCQDSERSRLWYRLDSHRSETAVQTTLLEERPRSSTPTVETQPSSLIRPERLFPDIFPNSPLILADGEQDINSARTRCHSPAASTSSTAEWNNCHTARAAADWRPAHTTSSSPRHAAPAPSRAP